MRIALASPRVAASLDEGLEKVRRFQAESAARGAAVVCFPEAYLPGLRGVDLAVLPFGPAEFERVLAAVADGARAHGVATIFGTERPTAAGPENVAVVFDGEGRLLGTQAKVQVAPSEDPHYVPGTGRHLFEIDGVTVGVAICHEAWRYPETVRWAAVRGAKVVFHPQHTGSDAGGVRLTAWGSPDAPYYEKAMACRGLENTIYFASVNYALRFPESATSVIDPAGWCQAYLPYGEEGVLVADLDLAAATGLLAARFAPERY